MLKYSLFLGLFFITGFSFANNPIKERYKKTKTVNKEFTVKHNNTVDIENKYGDITITTWNENKVSIEVIITVKSSDEEIGEKRLNSISIAFDQENNSVFAKTNITKKKNKWNFFKGNISIDTQIDYYIKMPIFNHVDIKNDYGSIFIDALDGKCKINCDYGSIRIGSLNNKTNNIYMDYGSSSTIEYINSGKINTDYSKLSIDKANNIEIVADYTNLEIEEVEYLKYNNDYGSFKIKKVQVLEGDGDYLTLKVYELDEQMTVSCDYGSIKVYQINKGFTKVYIDADYTGVKLGIENATSFNFDLSTSYADIKFEDLDVNFTYKEIKMFLKSYKGNVSQENNNSFIKVNSSYSNIKIYQADD